MSKTTLQIDRDDDSVREAWEYLAEEYDGEFVGALAKLRLHALESKEDTIS